jgi:hypothetical protein
MKEDALVAIRPDCSVEQTHAVRGRGKVNVNVDETIRLTRQVPLFRKTPSVRKAAGLTQGMPNQERSPKVQIDFSCSRAFRGLLPRILAAPHDDMQSVS